MNSQLSQQNASAGLTGDERGILWGWAERLCRVVAGQDLEGLPLYIVPQSRLAAEYGNAERAYAYTTPSLDLYLRPYLPGWQGRGPCMVINDLALAEDFALEDVEYLVCAHALHELAHILDRAELFAPRAEASPEQLQFELLVLSDTNRRPPRPDLPLYHGHGPAFLRIVVHLAYRASQAGFPVSAAGIFHGPRHGLSLAAEYEDAICNEPRRLTDLPMRQLLATEPPQPFLELWNQDQQRYSIRFTTMKEMPT